MLSTFDEVKSRTNMQDIAIQYGFTPNRSGFICCPFHAEKTPSCKLYSNSYYCYGCGEGGDCIKFVSRLFDITALDAVKKINADFGLYLNVGDKTRANISKQNKQTALSLSQIIQNYKDTEKHYFKVLNKYYKLLKAWKEQFAPISMDEEPYPLWVKACHELPMVDHYCMILCQAPEDERRQFCSDHADYIKQIEKELSRMR